MGIPLNQLPEHVQQMVATSRRKPNKYNVAPTKARTWQGRTYASKAEMLYAQELYTLRAAGEIIEIIEQPRVWLGVPENTYRPDFLVIPLIGHPYFVDVKGVETKEFRRIRKLWAQYGRLDLHIVRLTGRVWTAEVIGKEL